MTANKRELFFNRGAEAWRRVSGETQELYPCPICARVFDRPALEARELTLEHVPPKSVGGKEICLTCKSCNNTAGHAFDFAPAELQKITRVAEALGQRSGRFERLLTLNLDGDSVRVAATGDESGVKLRVIEEINNPANVSALCVRVRKLAEEGSTDFEFRLSATLKATPRQVFLSNLRAAFLSAFAILGYGYAFHPSLEIVRRQILEPDQETIPPIASKKVEGGADATVPMVYYIDKPVRAIGVHLPSTMILLPFPSLQVEDFYSQLTALCGPAGKVVMHFERRWPVAPLG